MNLLKKPTELPATQHQLNQVRGELNSNISRLEHKMNSRFNQVESKFNRLEFKIEEVLTSVHRTQALVEEMAQQNKYTVDAQNILYLRVTELEKKLP